MNTTLIHALIPADVYSIYLAAPFFNDEELSTYKAVIELLRASGYEVYVPQEHEVENAWGLENSVWGKAVFNEDIAAIKSSDAMVVINWGMYSDSGTAWEQGFAYALGKTVISLLVNDQPGKEFSLMMCNGCSIRVPFFKISDNTNYEQK